jgi:hypothetical protein
MNCRICDGKCEKEDAQYKTLCRTCGQKRETYAAAALTGLLASGHPIDHTDLVRDAFECAEDMVKFDRGSESK